LYLRGLSRAFPVVLVVIVVSASIAVSSRPLAFARYSHRRAVSGRGWLRRFHTGEGVEKLAVGLAGAPFAVRVLNHAIPPKLGVRRACVLAPMFAALDGFAALDTLFWIAFDDANAKGRKRCARRVNLLFHTCPFRENQSSVNQIARFVLILGRHHLFSVLTVEQGQGIALGKTKRRNAAILRIAPLRDRMASARSPAGSVSWVSADRCY